MHQVKQKNNSKKAQVSYFRGQVAVEKTSFSVLERRSVQDCQEIQGISCHARNLRGQVAVERTPFAASHLRAQVAAEFMLYISVFMVLVIAAFIVINNIQSSEIPLRQNTVAQGVGEGFSNAIALGVQGGRGFSYNYTFPKTILGYPYNITLPNKNYNLVLDWQGPYGTFSYSYKVPAYDYQVDNGNGCIAQELGQYIIQSNKCTNLLILNNDGEKLTISQLEGE
ncbi:hypothetical protein HY988_00700 [Candidatus Micrarchaeota archaeon]|nr:hypothetical protein [Candidatus Micrarchaeota archaeon]